MRMTRIDWILLPVLVAVLAGVVLGVFWLAGFFGLGVLGLLIGVMSQRIELEKDGAVGHVMNTSLYAEHRAETQALMRVLSVANIVSAGLVILGFGFFFLFQLG
jgi:hypothetical protein